MKRVMRAGRDILVVGSIEEGEQAVVLNQETSGGDHPENIKIGHERSTFSVLSHEAQPHSLRIMNTSNSKSLRRSGSI
jgi:hypothetical protein